MKRYYNMNVLVASAKGAKSLVITRSLGKRKISVINTDYNRFSASFFSRYSKGYFLCPSPKDYPDEYIKAILTYIKKNKIDVLMPVNSIETILISKHKDQFTPYTKVPFDNYSKMIKLHDKGKLAKLADELDIPIPKTYTINNLNDIEQFVNSVDYPLVIKLKESSSSIGINYIYSPDEFILKYKHTIEQFNLDPLNYPIIQQYIHGVGCGVSLLMNHGEVRALFTHKRLREFPVTGGPATLRESIRHQEMESIAVKLLKHVKWHGLAMVEFKLDQHTNKPYLIEVNPRFWGSINQAIMSGVDFPYLLYKMAVDGDIEPVLDYRLGVKTRFLMNDVRALISQCRSSKNRVKNIKDFFKLEGIHDDILSIRDPLPILFFTYIKMKQVLRKDKLNE